jgi:predicted RNA-binding protein with PIN domain
VSGHLVVDGNNVFGATADGWWRDRRGAARRLLARLQCYAAHTEATVVLVLDSVDPNLAEGEHGSVTVRYARRRGRNAADDRIRELLTELEGAVEVITSDRELAADARRLATVTGAGTFLGRLDAAGC